MAVLRTQITGPVRLPDGSTPPDGNKIIFTLTSWDKTDDAVIMHGPVEAQIESGAIDVSLHRVGTGLRQTAYRVDYVYHNAAARRWLTLSMGQIAPDGPGPYDLADLLSLPSTVPDSPSAAAQAIAAAVDAQEDADRAEAAAVNALIGTPYGFNTVPDLLANTSLSYTSGAGKVVVTAGQYVLAGGYRYQVAASGASDHHVATTGGVKLYLSAGHGASSYDIGVPLMQLGAIRNNGDQSDAYKFWRLIEDSSHKPIGFRNSAGAGLEIETTDSVIRVHHSIGGDYVGGLIASLDETLAQTGVRLGCSVGLTYSDIWLYRDFMANVNRSSGGVWQHDPNNAEPFTASWNAAGYLDITFPDTPSAIGIVQQIGSVEIGEWSAQFQQISATSARINFFHSKPKKHTARIRWNSGFSVLTGSNDITIGTFSGGLLPVSFTNGNVNDFDIQVTAGGGLNGIGYQCQIRNPSSTGFDLQWVNSAGAIVTAADNKMEAFVSAISRSQAEQPSPSTSFAVRVLSRSNINPKSISSTDYPAGNIWLVGGVVKERG